MPTQSAVDVHTGGLRLTVGAGSETGHRYPANFDVLHVEGPTPGGSALCVVVADGMGAGEGSATAGRTAVDTFADVVRRQGRSAAARSDDHEGSPVDADLLRSPVDADLLRSAVAEAQRRVGAAGERLRVLAGCTLTALVVTGETGWIAQVGDSRAYRWRGGLLELLTVDHTMAWLGAINGWYPADSPQAAADRYRLTRYVGHPDRPEPDLLNVALRPGDVFCLCTDGLAEQVPYQRLAEALAAVAARRAHPGQVVGALLADSLAAGGNDNTTVAVVAVTGAT